MKVVVGLGNPGTKYQGTRHNIGFDVVAYLAQSSRASARRSAFQADVVELTEDGEKLLLVQPQTFMNLSGRCVRAIIDFYKLPLDHLLVICDDLNLPLGKIRVRSQGSHGGQNGLRNIQEMLATDNYSRMRIGIGQPQVGDTTDYVLGRFRPGEIAVIEDATARAAQGVLLWAKEGIESCMNRLNPTETKTAKKKPTTTRTPPKRDESGNESP